MVKGSFIPIPESFVHITKLWGMSRPALLATKDPLVYSISFLGVVIINGDGKAGSPYNKGPFSDIDIRTDIINMDNGEIMAQCNAIRSVYHQ